MRKIVALTLFVGALFVAPTADAHHKHYRVKHGHYEPVYHGQSYYYERGYMPRRLHKHKSFRRWYRHTALRHNYRLDWWDLYSIYKLEKRYSPHRKYHRYKHYRNRGYNYYSRYWNDRYDHRHGYRNDRYRDDDRRERRRRHGDRDD